MYLIEAGLICPRYNHIKTINKIAQNGSQSVLWYALVCLMPCFGILLVSSGCALVCLMVCYGYALVCLSVILWVCSGLPWLALGILWVSCLLSSGLPWLALVCLIAAMP